MRKLYSAILIIFLSIICLAYTVEARMTRNPFDHVRRGPIASFTVGPGFTRITSENYGMTGDITKGTVAFIYKIGYCFDDRFILYASHRSSVYGSKIGEHYNTWFDKIDFKEGQGFALALVTPVVLPFIALLTDQHLTSGIGIMYYVRPRMPSWFFDAAIGPSVTADPYESEHVSSFPRSPRTGIGFCAGFGYEFARHFQTEIQFMYSSKKWEIDDDQKKWTALSLMWTLTVIGF
ncbi:MAG: hypothetical protein ACOYVF_02335 [Candidatus Zixiibacteriota bacterium]